MKKVLIASGVAVLAFAMIASAQGYTFNANLTVGSTGADVVALQTWLNANGFAIPAIVSGAAKPGYFGQMTQSAVKAYQASKGIPNTGFVGPLTRGALNAGGGAASVGVTTCPAGFTCTANTPVPVSVVCPTGYTCTPQAGTVGTTVTSGLVMDGTDGSVTISTSAFVSTTQTLKKGDLNKAIAAVNAQATAGNVGITRFDVHFSSRPWLLFSSLDLKDSTGAVLATKTLSSSADVTEVTVGTDYLVRFDGINAVVSPNVVKTFVVYANVLAASDKIANQVVTVTVPAGSIRSINGKGYTDSLGLAPLSNSLTMSSSGSTGDLYTRISPTTPNQQTVNISTTNSTNDQVLGVFDLKLQNQNGTINTLVFNVNNSKALSPIVVQNLRLYDGGTLIAGASTFTSANPGVATFANLSIPLTVDVWKTLTLKADVIASSTASTASSTLVAASVVGVDANYNTITLSSASNATSNDIAFVPNAGLTITGITALKGSVTTPTTGTWLVAYPSIAFTVNNTGSNAIYISKTANVALATTTSVSPNASTTVSSTVASGSTTGDTTAAYIINGGGSRTFTYNFTVDNTNGSTASKKISVTQINYGTSGASDSVDNTLNVNYGLESAFVQIP